MSIKDLEYFFKPHFDFKVIDGKQTKENILKDFVRRNHPELVKKQSELYKKEGKYRSNGQFIKEEIASEQKNADDFYQRCVNGKIKDISKYLPNLMKLPISQKKLEEIEDYFNFDFLNVSASVSFGVLSTEHLECHNFLLNIFSSFEESGRIWEDLEEIARRIEENLEFFSELDVHEHLCSLQCYEYYFDLNIIQNEDEFLNNYIMMFYIDILKDGYKAAKNKNSKKFNQALFMKWLDPEGDSWNEDSEWEDHYRNIYQQFVKGNRIPKGKWLTAFKKLVLSMTESESEHSKEVQRYKEIKSSLEMGEIVLNNIPNLIYPISKCMQKIHHKYSGEKYLKQLSKELRLMSDVVYQELSDADLL